MTPEDRNENQSSLSSVLVLTAKGPWKVLWRTWALINQQVHRPLVPLASLETRIFFFFGSIGLKRALLNPVEPQKKLWLQGWLRGKGTCVPAGL